MYDRLKQYLPLLVALAVWGGMIALQLFPSNYLHGTDGYYHVRVSQVMVEQGMDLESFPYATESIWSNRFFDKEWLFHVYLMPFLGLGLLRGAQVAVLLLNLGIVLALWYGCRRMGLRQPGWLIALLPFLAYTALWERLLLCRPHLFSIILLFLAFGAMVSRRRLLLGLISLVYALSYTGHWQLLGLVFIYDCLYGFLDEEGRRRERFLRGVPLLVPAFVGMAIGEIIHPQFPTNIIGLYIQNVRVLWQYWQGQSSEILFMMRPDEMRAYPMGEFFVHLWFILAGLVAAGIYLMHRRPRLDRTLVFMAICTAGYLFMTWRSKRFTEYFVAVAVVFLGLCWERYELGKKLKWRGLKGLGAVLVGALVVTVVYQAGERARHLSGPLQQAYNRQPFQVAGEWLAEHGAEGEIVFATSWSDNPFLWFQAPEQRYLVFLDPYFMYAQSPERFALWHQTRIGLIEEPIEVIRVIFGARYVFTQRNHNFQLLIDYLDGAPGVERVVDKASYLLYRLPAPPP